jgi:hypothetical protein
MKNSFRELEEKLLNPDVRKSSLELQGLLSDDFIEYGSSGKTYNKQQVIESLQHESTDLFSILEFNVRELGQGIVLATYRVQKTSRNSGNKTISLRSSIWKLQDGNWKIVFHQGTNIL